MNVISRLLPIAGSAFSLQVGSSCLLFVVPVETNESNMALVLAAVFVPQANEKWYDLGGSLGFLSTTFVSLYYPTLKAKYWEGASVSFPPLSSFAPRQQLLTAILVIWTVRLGSFLVRVSDTLALYATWSICDPAIPCSAPSRLGETHVLTRSSIRLGPLPPSGWPRVC